VLHVIKIYMGSRSTAMALKRAVEEKKKRYVYRVPSILNLGPGWKYSV
jgi:hypothetical protein